jgi:hypothetical protein
VSWSQGKWDAALQSGEMLRMVAHVQQEMQGDWTEQAMNGILDCEGQEDVVQQAMTRLTELSQVLECPLWAVVFFLGQLCFFGGSCVFLGGSCVFFLQYEFCGFMLSFHVFLLHLPPQSTIVSRNC